MIVTENFVFIHVHKCGGQFVNRLLLETYSTARKIGYHYPLRELPKIYNHLPVLAFVRNPWDWYVSWYCFNREYPARNPIFRVLSEKGVHDFAATITRLLTLSDSKPESIRLSEIIKSSLPDSYENNTGSGITKNRFGDYVRSCQGYFSWLIGDMLSTDNHGGPIYIGKLENIQYDLLNFIREIDGSNILLLEKVFGGSQKVNQSERDSHIKYYDDDLKTLVAKQDHKIVEDWGYCY